MRGVDGQTSALLDDALNHKEAAVATVKASLEAGATGIANGTVDDDACGARSACTAELASPFCAKDFGNTRGCKCAGRSIDNSEPVVKTSPKLGVSDQALKRAACLAKHITPTLKNTYSSIIEKGDAKWIYFGSNDGVVINYPGFVWGDPTAADKCDELYDSRIRPWQMTAATGPKNVVLILDTSGSMDFYNRITLMKQAAKKVIDSATHADYIGIVEFNSRAKTYAGLTTMARALPAFRNRLKTFIDTLGAGGATDFIAGYTEAFKLIDSSRQKQYVAGCHTTYVFLTDGDADVPTSLIQNRQATNAGKDEHHFIVSMGAGTSETKLRQLSCDIGGVFMQVNDNDEAALQRAMTGYYKYYALQKTLSKVEGYSWSEPYTSIPDIWGPLTSVSAPVYDKSRGEPWHMMGVVAADATVCDLVQKAPDTPASASPKTVTVGLNALPTSTPSVAPCAGVKTFSKATRALCLIHLYSPF